MQIGDCHMLSMLCLLTWRVSIEILKNLLRITVVNGVFMPASAMHSFCTHVGTDADVAFLDRVQFVQLLCPVCVVFTHLHLDEDHVDEC